MEVPGETSRRGRDTEPFSSDKVHSDNDNDDDGDGNGDGDGDDFAWWVGWDGLI